MSKRLVRDLADRIEDETRRRPGATVDDIAEAVCQSVDDRLCDWIGPTQASAWWRRWAENVTGERVPVRDEFDDAA